MRDMKKLKRLLKANQLEEVDYVGLVKNFPGKSLKQFIPI